MDGRIRLTLPNVVIIGSVAALTTVAGLAGIHWLSNHDIPVLSPTARGAVDFVNKAVAA
jgi:hypothetical protein